MPYICGSLDIGFCHGLLQVGFVPTAVVGTCICLQSQSWLPPRGIYLKDMISATHAAMAAYGSRAVLRGVLWVQVRQLECADNM